MIKIFLISACVAASANADWEWYNNDMLPNFDNLFKFNFPKMPKIEIPEIKMPDIKMPDIKMPDVKMPDMKISPEDIASFKGPGYGVSMVTINGETVVTINNGGNVETYKVPAGSTKEQTSVILAGTAVNN